MNLDLSIQNTVRIRSGRPNQTYPRRSVWFPPRGNLLPLRSPETNKIFWWARCMNFNIFVRKGDHHKETTRRILSIKSKLGTCRNNPPATPTIQRAENPRFTRVTAISCNNELRHACIRTQFRICNLLCIYQYYSKSMKYTLKINETKYSHCTTKRKNPKDKQTNNRAILYKFELNSTKYVLVVFSV